MRILLSSIGSRGDVQPILALAVALRELGHEPRLCVAPNFKEWVESFGVACSPIGPDVRAMTGGTRPRVAPKLSDAQRQRLAAQTVRDQFAVVGEAARDCDMIVGAGALQIAAPSVAASLGLPYVFAAYCPVMLPSAHHPPPEMDRHHSPALPRVVNRVLWMRQRRSWNRRFRATLNAERAKLGFPPIASVQPYVVTDRPWLAADPVLGPAAERRRAPAVQTGAWLLRDPAPLPDALERFLADGEPPVYFGFGSMRTSEQAAPIFLESARALGVRAIVSRGWAGLDSPGQSRDVISIGDVNHERLFPRVAAVVHHGGAGTTTTVARAGTPQVIVPHNYDQWYWAGRVGALGVGASIPGPDQLTVSALTSALRTCFRSDTTARAAALAPRITLDGARRAAEMLVGASAGR